MFDDEHPTATSAEKWLSFHRWLQGEVHKLSDKFLRDFSAPWAGAGDAKPPQDLHTETIALQRKQEKAASEITVAGLQLLCDENGAITMIGSGGHYLLVSSVYAQEFRNAINQLIPAADIPVIDLNTDPNVVPGAGSGMMSAPNAPMTNAQMSQRQNELVARQLKKRR